MQRSIRSRLNDIIRAIDGVADTIGGIDFDTFQAVYHMPRTVERCIEIVSEATRHIPDDVKSRYPDIRHQIAGIGNVLRHNYDLVDQKLIWEVAKVHFPQLRMVVVEVLAQLRDDDK
jgi:uncharacterized protein with HEPN domain